MLLYPVVFVAVARAQLFTENTLYPVVLDERAHVLNALRLWVTDG